MAHQLSCDDEHSDGAINQHYRCCLFGTRRRNRIGSIRTCGNILFSDLYAGVWIQHWSAGYDCPKKWEQHYKEAGRTFFQGLYFLMAMAIMLSLLIQLVSPFILQRLITSDEIYQAVIRYLDWRSFGLLFSFPFLAFRAFLVGITNTKALSGVALTAVCINMPFNYLLIFKLDMGISGAAMASSIAEFGAFLILLLYMCKTVDKKKYGLSAVYDDRLLIKLLQLSVWSMLHAFISVAPWFLFFVAIEHLGKTELAISNITRSVSTLFFVIVNSFASTTGSLVSNLIGAGQGKELFPVCRKVLRLGYVVGLPLILTALWGNQWIIGFYTNDDYSAVRKHRAF